MFNFSSDYNTVRMNSKLPKQELVSSVKAIANLDSLNLSNQIASGKSFLLEGNIIAKNQKGEVLLNTKAGNLILTDAKDLNKGDAVTLRVDNKNNQLSGRLVAINHRHYQDDKSSLQTKDTVNISQQSNNSKDQIVTAKLISQNHNNFQQIIDHFRSSPQHAEKFNNFLKTLLNLPNNEFNIKIEFGFNSNNLAKSGNDIITNLVKSLNLATQAKNSLNDSTNFNIRNENIGIKGEILKNHNGPPLIRTPLGLISLDSKVNLNNIQNITLTLQNIVASQAQLAGIAPSIDLAKNFYSKIYDNWQNFGKIINILKKHTTNHNYQKLISKLPTSDNNNMLQKLIAFSYAIRNGQLEDIFDNDTINDLELHGHKRLITDLTNDFKAVKQIFNNQRTDEMPWQAMLIPVYNQDEINYFRFFVKNSNKDENYKRFIIEVDLEYLPKLQIDGLYEVKEQQQKLFNLIIRHTDKLPNNLQSQIKQIYLDNQELVNISGQLKFEQVANFHINPVKEIKNQQFSDNNIII